MAVRFIEESHSYTSLDPNENIDWVSVTKLTGMFKPKFDPITQSEKSSKNSKSKWYKVPPEKIRELWEKESKRSTDLGTWYHKEREKDLCSVDTITRAGVPIPIIRPIENLEEKIAPEQRLGEGIYPEHFVYLKSEGVCGQSDRVEVVGDVVDIFDYKTNKEITTAGHKSWDGTISRLEKPLHHLEDCHLVHYGLQLSTYLYIILKHNPMLKPGKLWIHHVVFKNCGHDEFGYPIVCKDENDNPIPEKVVPYEVPYYKREVELMFKFLKNSKK